MQEIDFSNKCFVMMPFSTPEEYEKSDPNHFKQIYNQIFIPAIEAAGFEPYRLAESFGSVSIVGEIFEAIQNCPMALCDLSSRNPNVLYELGLRHAYDKPVVLVKDEKTSNIFDVAGIRTIPYNSHRLVENVSEAIENIAQALKETAKSETIAKIIQVNAAQKIDTETPVSEKDNIAVMLQTIMTELNNIKQSSKMNSIENNSSERNTVLRVHRYIVKENISSDDLLHYLSKLENELKEKFSLGELKVKHLNPKELKLYMPMQDPLQERAILNKIAVDGILRYNGNTSL